jgi:hypothetical protein
MRTYLCLKHMHLVYACTFEWVHIFESWCLKHMHSVCASGVHISRIMVSQAYAFGMCKSEVLNGYTFPKVWCLKHMHSVYMQVLPSIGTYFQRSGGVSNICIQYVQVLPSKSAYWCLKHVHLACASAASPKVKLARKWKLAEAVLHVWGPCLCKCGLQHPFIFQVMMV